MQEAAAAVQERRVQDIPGALLQQRDVVGGDALRWGRNLVNEQLSLCFAELLKRSLSYIQEVVHALASQPQHAPGLCQPGY